MADKSFGVKDINLIGASGTPEIESPNNLNIKATNVAISTDMSIGGELTIADKIVHTGDTNTAIRFPADDTVTVETAGSERLRITSAGKVGIGTDNPQTKLELFTNDDTDIQGDSGTNNQNSILRLFNKNGTDDTAVNNYVGIRFDVANGATSSAYLNYVRTGNNQGAFLFKARNSSSSYPELMRITSAGKLCIGSASDEDLQFGTDANAILQLSTAAAPKLILCRDDTSITTNDYLGIIDFHSRDGGIKRVARIGARAGGNHGADDGPTDLVFHTMGDNTATTAEERLRITYDGRLVLPTSSPGIQFGSNNTGANISSQTLDDYEEGTWTPIIKSGSNVISYSGGTQKFTYTKIGNIVNVVFSMENSTTSGTVNTDSFHIDGIPFHPSERTMGHSVMFYSSGLRVNVFPTYPEFNVNTGSVTFLNKSGASSNYVNSYATQVGANSYFFWTHTYRTAQ